MNGASRVVIRVVRLAREYAMGGAVVHALRGVDLTVHAGEFLALMGASGSGKSTLLNMIGLLDRPTSGQYRLEDLEVFSLSRSFVADAAHELHTPLTALLANIELAHHEKSASEYPGNGLGLAIVKAIVNAHQGDVAVQSEPMQGTSISVSLPIK